MTSSRDVYNTSRVVRASDFNAEVATALGSIPASSDGVKSEGRQTKQCRIKYTKKSKKIPLLKTKYYAAYKDAIFKFSNTLSTELVTSEP